MCHTSRSLPVAIPLARRRQSEGVVELEYTLALAKATTLHDGVHRSTRGARPFPYPLGRGWVWDYHAVPRSRTECLHYSTPGDALRGRLSSYGSHRLITFALRRLNTNETLHGERCWHDRATLPVCCLACDAGDDPSALAAPEFWAELRGRYGGDLGGGLYRARAVLPEALAPRRLALG